MANTQFLGWAPPPRQIPGQFNWFGPAMQGYQQGLESQRQRMDMTNMSQPGYIPKSREYGSVYAKQQMQTPLQEAQTGYYDERTKLLQNAPPKPTPEAESAKKTLLIDVDRRLYDVKGKGSLTREEHTDRVNKIERFFRSPEGMQATPQQIEAFYVGLESTPEKKKSLMGRLAGSMRGGIKSALNSKTMNRPMLPQFQSPQVQTQTKYKKGQPVTGPDGKKYRVMEDSDDPLLEPL